MQALLPLWALSLFFSPGTLSTLEEARRELGAQQALEGRVPRALARDAAARISARTSAAELRVWGRIARAGGAERELAGALLEVGGQGPRGVRDVALETLRELPPAALRAALGAGPFPRALRFQLEAEVDRLVEAGASQAQLSARLRLLSPVLPPRALGRLLARWDDPEAPGLAALLLDSLRWSLSPGETYAALARARLSAELIEPLGAALARLVAEGASEVALRHVELERWGQGSPVLASLVGLPPRRWDEVRRQVLDQLPRGGDAHRAAALEVATASLLPEALADARQLAADPARAPRLRRAGLRALVELGYRDAPTLELLVSLLSDAEPSVAGAAHAALLRKGGARLPARPEAWRRWLSAQALPPGPPADRWERLAQQRALRIRLDRRRAEEEAEAAREEAEAAREEAEASARAGASALPPAVAREPEVAPRAPGSPAARPD